MEGNTRKAMWHYMADRVVPHASDAVGRHRAARIGECTYTVLKCLGFINLRCEVISDGSSILSSRCAERGWRLARGPWRTGRSRASRQFCGFHDTGPDACPEDAMVACGAL